MVIFNKLNLILETLQGSKVSKVIAGGGNGSIIIIDIDNKYSLYILCDWRLITNDDVIVTSYDDSDVKHGKIPIYLKKLHKEVVKKISIINRYDINIEFQNETILTIFSNNNKSSNTIDENWSFVDIENNISYNLTNEFVYSSTKYDESI